MRQVELRQLRHAIAVLQAAHAVLLEGETFFTEQLVGAATASPCKSCEEVPPVRLRMLDCSLSLAKLPTATLPLLAASLLELFLMQPSQLLSYTEVDRQASLVLDDDSLARIPEDIAAEINFYAAAWTPLAVVGPLGFGRSSLSSLTSARNGSDARVSRVWHRANNLGAATTKWP